MAGKSKTKYSGGVKQDRKILLLLAAVILIPVLLYTGLELSRVRERENLLRESYRAQLKAILFSVNQRCWDTVESWGNHLRMITQRSSPRVEPQELSALLEELPRRYSPIAGAFVKQQDSWSFGVAGSLAGSRTAMQEMIAAALIDSARQVQRLTSQAAKGYFRALPIQFNAAREQDWDLLFVFSLADSSRLAHEMLGGLLISSRIFVDRIVQPYVSTFREQGLTVTVASDSSTILANDRAREDIATRLWILPRFTLAIQTEGQTSGELASAKTQQSLFVIVMLNVAILAAVFVLMRTLWRETQLARLKADFVAHVSHDLRTPLGLIRMFAETLMLGRAREEEKKHEYYGIIAREAERLTHMVNNVLDFSRLEAGGKEFAMHDLLLNEVIANALASYRFHLQQRQFRVEEKIANRLPPVKGDAQAVSQAFLNLLDNAIKYSDQNKHIIVEVDCNERHAIVRVTDHGRGIAPQYHDKIFNKFYRIDHAGGDSKGAGIGLAIVQHIMQAHHGSVEVQSAPGKGSTFSLKFPLHKELHGNDTDH